MKMVRSFAVAAALLGALGFSVASHANGLSGQQNVKELKMRSDGIVLISGKTGAWDNPDSCTNAKYVALDSANAYYREIMAFVLAAKSGKFNVDFYTAGCMKINAKTYAVVKNLNMQ